jgi:hypothetical protein
MANGNDYSQAKQVVIPVVHPSGDIHNISVPEDTSLEDFHSALVKAGYDTPQVSAKQEKPTPEGSLEYSKEFKDNARQLWSLSGGVNSRSEAGNFLSEDNSYSTPVVSKNLESGQGRINFGEKPAGAKYVIHTHPRTGGPSEQDKATAKNNKMDVYVVDSNGLHLVEPDGKITRVYQSVGQATAVTPKPKPKFIPHNVIKTIDGKQVEVCTNCSN